MTTENQTKERKRRMRPDPEPVDGTPPETPSKTTRTRKPKPEPAAPPSQTGAGRPTVYDVPVIEGEADILPNATGIAKAMYQEVITTVVARAEAGSKAWTIVNPMGRKATTVQSGIKEAAKDADPPASIETRLVGEDADKRVYVRVLAPKA